MTFTGFSRNCLQCISDREWIQRAKIHGQQLTDDFLHCSTLIVDKRKFYKPYALQKPGGNQARTFDRQY